MLELGGKDAMIVFDDANLELAAGAAVWGAFCNAGQSCSSVERLYVQENVADKLTSLIVEKTRQLKQGSGDREDVSIGAMSSERQLAIVEDHVRDFVKHGARVEIGGSRNTELEGLFYEPTVISGARNDMRAMQEETFGPTLPIATFKTEEEAIALANDSVFGLQGAVFTESLREALTFVEKFDVGALWINEASRFRLDMYPFGGVKQSGVGREGVRYAIEELSQLKFTGIKA